MGSRIKAVREERNLSQTELAEALGFQSATAISLIEKGERGIPAALLQRVSEVLQRDVKFFLGQKEDAPVDIQVALRADPDLSKEDKDALSRFINLAKRRPNVR
mgnify:FL=1